MHVYARYIVLIACGLIAPFAAQANFLYSVDDPAQSLPQRGVDWDIQGYPGKGTMVAGCNTDNKGDPCFDNGDISAPSGFIICWFSGSQNVDGGNCQTVYQSPDQKTLSVTCTANTQEFMGAPYGGGGHAYYYLSTFVYARSLDVCKKIPPEKMLF